jgi:hypothetical protein
VRKIRWKKISFSLPSENLVQILPGSGSALDPDPVLNPDPHSSKILDPDPHTINAETLTICTAFTRNFKSKWTRSWCVETSDQSNDTKKHTTESRETIPLRYCCTDAVARVDRNLTLNCRLLSGFFLPYTGCVPLELVYSVAFLWSKNCGQTKFGERTSYREIQ